MEQELTEFGLTNNEVKVYIACLKLGISLVQEIAMKAGTYRTYTYEVLKSLIKKGLVSYVIKNGKQYFEVAEPEKFISILKEKHDKITRILPELRGLYKTAIEKPEVNLYEGKEGVKTIFDDIIRTGKEVLIYGNTENQIKIFSFYFPNYILRRVENKIHTKVITEKSPTTISMLRTEKKELRETRFIDKIKFSTVTYIYDNKIAIFALEKEIIGVLIENKSIADTQKQIFGALWKISKK